MTKFTPTLSKHILRCILMLTLLAAFGVSAALAQTRAYVTNDRDNTVSVIDTATTSVIATIPVGLGPTAVAGHSERTLRLRCESTWPQRLSD